MSHPKDRVPMMNKSNVVYKVECADCDATYVGETKRRLENRIAEHRKAVERGDSNASAIAEHAWAADHRVAWESTTILSVDSGHYSRLAREAIHIRKQKKALNRDLGQLNSIYNVLLSKRDERRNNARGMREEETVSKSKRDEGRNNGQENERRRNNERRK